jgi:hypothetical protein
MRLLFHGYAQETLTRNFVTQDCLGAILVKSGKCLVSGVRSSTVASLILVLLACRTHGMLWMLSLEENTSSCPDLERPSRPSWQAQQGQAADLELEKD